MSRNVPASAVGSRAAALFLMAAVGGCTAQPESRLNQVTGTWRMVSATVEDRGNVTRPYGPRPAGMLVFTPDMHFVEVLTDPDTPRFASDERGGGTDAENRRAMASSIGFFGTYSVDAEGRFAGNRVEGATFPNWVGGVRTTRELRMTVEGDRMTEVFTRPDGGVVRAAFVRAGRGEAR
jgi:hypothetical protein